MTENCFTCISVLCAILLSWFKTNKNVGLLCNMVYKAYGRAIQHGGSMALDEVFKNSPGRRHFALLSSSHLERL